MSHLNLNLLFILIISICTLFAPPSTACPDLAKVNQMGKELTLIIEHELCTNEMSLNQLKSIKKSIVQHVMTKTFLGVEPPPGWQKIADEIEQDCYSVTNLCLKTSQEKMEQCIVEKMPVLMLEFGPWFADHCEQINKTIVQNWRTKKALIANWLFEAILEFS